MTTQTSSIPTHISSDMLKLFDSTKEKDIECKAAVAWAPNQPMDYTTIIVSPPRAGEVRVKVLSNALCHTDVYTLEGHDAEGKFPCILGHEAVAVVESVGHGVTSVIPGDIVVPCYTPQCMKHDCIFCNSEKTNMCPTIRSTQGVGVMPDGTTRYKSKDGKEIFHFMGCSTFSEYSVISEISAAKINPDMDPDLGCLLGCGVATGWGAVFNTSKVTPGSTVVVFGLGALGLSVIQAAKTAGATYIVGVDINSKKFDRAITMGATECVNSFECENRDVKPWLMARQQWGYDFTFDCTGNVKVMRDALEICHRGYGKSCIIGVAPAGHEIATRPFQLVIGKQWVGTAFGGWKSRSEVPKLIQTAMRGEMDLKPYVTHTYDGLEHVNTAVEALHSGDCLRAVVRISQLERAVPAPVTPTLMSDVKVYGGQLKRMCHWSVSNQCDMTFSVFIPSSISRLEEKPGVLYYLSGLTCTDENARTKAGAILEYANQYNLAVVFPGTSAPAMGIEGEVNDWSFGVHAGFYLNATTDKYSKHYNMDAYITVELPLLIGSMFTVDETKTGIMGHSMGGMGALNLHLKNPGKYKSVSAFSPLCNPTETPWGRKAFEGYLGSVSAGSAYDPSMLLRNYNGPQVPILIDQGTHDSFLHTELKPEVLKHVAGEIGYPVTVRMQGGYDHSYFFIATFIKDHIEHHAWSLGLKKRF